MRKIHVLAVLLALAAAIAVACNATNQKPDSSDNQNEAKVSYWQVDQHGYLSYPSERENVRFRSGNHSQTDSLLISKVVYESRDGNIYGLLVLPKEITEPVPGVVLLPGAGVSKESELRLAEKIAELGAAVFAIDQRGVGETNGKINSIKDDYIYFLNGREPVQHLMVYDALRAHDLLRSAPFIDPDRVILAGESLGGRIAVIAAAIDKNIKGALIISSAGLDLELTNDTSVNAFLQSIDSDHYIDLISPRRLVMIHSLNDTIIPISSAAKSYSKAQAPKEFILVNDTSCTHGYCDAMWPALVESLDYLVEIRSKTIVSVPID